MSDAERYVLGWRFGWRELMDAARQRASKSGRRQRVTRQVIPRHGDIWLVMSEPEVGAS